MENEEENQTKRKTNKILHISKALNRLLELNILSFKYKYKDAYSTGDCYRCIYRSTFKLTILITFEEYNKLIQKELEIEEIKFIINTKEKQKKFTKCEIIETKTDKILTKEEYSFAVNLIKLHKDKKQYII